MTNIAIEVGGTFTDLIWINSTGEICTHKVPSTPDDPSQGVVRGMQEALGKNLAQISRLIHGSTVATNAVLERKGCRAALLTTEGFRDLLVLQRQLRPNVYAIACRKPQPLIPLDRTAEVVERLDASGNVVKALDEAALMAAADVLFAAEQPEAVAVCLLHSYRDSTHERRVREILQARFPGVPVILSAEILPTFREYERASTTAMAAYLAPLVDRYLSNLESFLSREAGDAVLFIMQSSGGVLPSEGARNQGVDMLNSGPAAGVIGTRELCASIKLPNAIAFDMGGTTAKAGVILNGVELTAGQVMVGGYNEGLPIQIPMIDIEEVGTGGGSIARVETGAAMRVGPQSAGAVPGPVCYGNGGTEPTITDANVVLGRLTPELFLGGEMQLDVAGAEAAIAAKIADPLGLSVIEAADGIVRIAVTQMGNVVKRVTTERGLDAREFAMVAYGGAGPLHATLVARELKINRVIIPVAPGHFSAYGMLVTDLRRDFVRSLFARLADAPFDTFDRIFAEMQQRGRADIKAAAPHSVEIKVKHAADMRYVGQEHAVTVEVPGELFAKRDIAGIKARFDAVHQVRYGYASADESAEIVSLRLSVTGVIGKPSQAPLAAGTGTVDDALISVRPVEFGVLGGRIDTPIYAREKLGAGHIIDGPALIQEYASTTVLAPGDTLSVDALGNLDIAVDIQS